MIYEVIKYCDIFGTKFHFYTDEKPKFYTLFGGVSSIILFFICLITFIFYSLDDFKRNNPIVTTSSIPSEGHPNIKFGKEKIWIPWRIVDSNNKFIEHIGLIYPIIYYYSRSRNNTNDPFISNIKKLNYTLCNETSMINKSDLYQIGVSLSQLYCIDMDNLEIGGSWASLFLNYIQVNFYLCEDGIDYNNTSPKCTNKEKILQKIGTNNSLRIEFYYPVVQFQQTNISIPIIVTYKQLFYQISKNTNKIDRLYIQEHILENDLGWITNKKINSTFWGFSAVDGDSYSTTDTRDFIKGGSTSKSYSLNLYLEPETIYYKRKYKKFFQIVVESLPIIFVIFKIFKKAMKIFKNSEENKKFFELLFENHKQKQNKFAKLNEKIMVQQSKQEHKDVINYNKDNGNIIKKIVQFNCHSSYDNRNQSAKDCSHINLIDIQKSNRAINFNSKYNSKNKDFNSPIVHKKDHSKNLKQKRRKSLFSKSPIENGFSILRKEEQNKQNYQNQNELSNIMNEISENKLTYKIKTLFPFKYYFFSIFVKNFDIAKFKCFFSKKFTKVYKFMSKIFDVSSYLKLMREFEILKNTFLNESGVNYIERPRKINVNERLFLRNMNECIEGGNFNIFSSNIAK